MFWTGDAQRDTPPDDKCAAVLENSAILSVMQQTTSREEIAANVRAAKARRRVTDAQIAEAIGVSRSGVNERIRGQAHFRVDELQAIAAYLEVPLEQLLAPATSEVAS